MFTHTKSGTTEAADESDWRGDVGADRRTRPDQGALVCQSGLIYVLPKFSSLKYVPSVLAAQHGRLLWPSE